jgi:hypothetical protein
MLNPPDARVACLATYLLVVSLAIFPSGARADANSGKLSLVLRNRIPSDFDPEV